MFNSWLYFAAHFKQATSSKKSNPHPTGQLGATTKCVHSVGLGLISNLSQVLIFRPHSFDARGVLRCGPHVFHQTVLARRFHRVSSRLSCTSCWWLRGRISTSQLIGNLREAAHPYRHENTLVSVWLSRPTSCADARIACRSSSRFIVPTVVRG